MVEVEAPVQGTRFSLRPLNGSHELLLLEAERLDIGIAVCLLEQVLVPEDGGEDLMSLPICDVDALMLRLRQHVLGDQTRIDTACSGCGKPVSVTFSIDAFLTHHSPERPDVVIATEEPGWFRLSGTDVLWRVPRARDQLDIASSPHPEQALWQRCVRPDVSQPELRAAVEAAMERVAPDLTGELRGECVECGTQVAFELDPLVHTLAELTGSSAYLYADVAAIAHYFHWSEAEILALPRQRRQRYAERAASARGRG